MIDDFVREITNLRCEKEQLNSLVNSCQEKIRKLKKQLEESDFKIANLTMDKIELKKQLEENKDKINWYENFEINKTIDELRIKHNNQQKKFIDYLENEIYSIEPKGTGINYNCEYDSEEVYRVYGYEAMLNYTILIKILQKYKEIIGDKEWY